MKLFEIIHPTVKTVDSKSDPYAIADNISGNATGNTKLLQILGSGAYGTVSQHKNRPGTVIKTSKPTRNLEEDGYFQYLKVLLSKDRMMSNPYFPKIYSVKIYQTTSERGMKFYNYVVEMERLSATRLSQEEVLSMAERMFHPSIIEENKTELNDPKAGIWSLGVILFQAVGGTVPLSKVIDPMLKQAIAFIKYTIKKTGKYNDLAGTNVMVRRTSIGPQLVITDPIS